jgi:hypothetical protein
MEEVGQTRQSRRERTKTPKALEHEKTMHQGKAQSNPAGMASQRAAGTWEQDESDENGIEETIHVAETAPGAPRPNRTTINPQFKNQIAPTSNRTSTAKLAEQLAAASTVTNQIATEKANITTSEQIKGLTDLVTKLVRAMEEEKQAHANQIESLT